MKVIYIAGWGRSGSTLLARILGQVQGIAHLGELRTLWTDGYKAKSRCGCGLPTRECEVWNAIMQQAFGGLEQVDLKAMVQLRRQSEPRSQELFKLRFLPAQRQTFLQRSQPYREVLAKLYQAIGQVCGVDTVVDDSLHPGYGYTLAAVPGLEVYLVHLIRDVRGCTYSWTKRQKSGLGSYELKDSSLGWNLRNLAIETLPANANIHYHRLRYEDFVSQPQQSVEEILKFAQLEPHSLPFATPSEVNLGITHSIFGNDNRASTGTVTLRLDEVWKQKMARSDQLKVSLMTWPLLMKYGY
ncbi:MAG: sulfotransferase [Cyanobacteria bacterium J06638_28]